MRQNHKKPILFGTLLLTGLIILLFGCANAGAGGTGEGSTCDDTASYTVEWKFSGSYTDSVSVSTTWVKPSGEFSDPSDTKYATINPSDSTLLTETLPGCSGATINIIMIDPSDGSDGNTTVTLTNITLSIYVDGNLADSVVLNGTYPDGEILPSAGGLTIVVGE